jgi:hypothetical protein
LEVDAHADRSPTQRIVNVVRSVLIEKRLVKGSPGIRL